MGRGWPPRSPATGRGTSQGALLCLRGPWSADPPTASLLCAPGRAPDRTRGLAPPLGTLCAGSAPSVPVSRLRTTGRAQGGKPLAEGAAGPGHGSRARRPNARSGPGAGAPCRLVPPTPSDLLPCGGGRLPPLRCPQTPPGRQVPVQQQEVGLGPTRSWPGGLCQPGHKGWTAAATQMGRKLSFPPLPPGRLA